MNAERPVRFFRNGRNQAVRIPREFELPGESGTIRKEGDRLIIEPAARKLDIGELLDRWAAEPPLDPAEDPWAEIDDFPPEPVDDLADFDER
jgi:antitoxin VapB